jgi:hypothetical protein
LHAIQPSARQALAEVCAARAAGVEVTKKPAQLKLESRIADKQAALACPSSYKELDSRLDRARLKEIEAESTRRPLVAAEQFEQRYLEARFEVYSWTPEAADCRKMNLIKALADLRTAEDERELEGLKTRYGDIPLDSTLIEDREFKTTKFRRLKGIGGYYLVERSGSGVRRD